MPENVRFSKSGTRKRHILFIFLRHLLLFGYDCQTRVVNWIKESPDIRTDSHIIDLGCGNGSLLIELVRKIIT